VKLLDKSLMRFAIVCLTVAAIVFLFHSLIHINPTTVGFIFLLAVLIVSAAWGLRYAVFLALISTLAYNFYFLPPVGTFTISDPQNWVSLAAFLLTAVIASELAERARREAFSAVRRRNELERLYAFSQRMLTTENVLTLVNDIPSGVVETFGGTSAGMFLIERKKVYYSDAAAQGEISEDELRLVSSRGDTSIHSERGTVIIPLRVGVRSVGAIRIDGIDMGRESLDALGSLIAIAIERAGAVEKLARAEANRESERLRSILLDSVTHDFRTPLTSIKASSESLLSDDTLDESARHELLTIINEESDRLDRLVGEAAQMAQLDAGAVELHLELHHIRDAIEAAIEATRNALAKHPVTIEADHLLPRVMMDVRRIGEVLAQLLDNAGKYSAPGTAIKITAAVQDGMLVTSVADQGPGIDDLDQSMIFDKFYRGRGQRSTIQGTGMGLAISKAMIEAHHGSISVLSQVGRGSVFSFALPIRSR
jgi:two-component system sensor histidine kinase KdpD